MIDNNIHVQSLACNVFLTCATWLHRLSFHLLQVEAHYKRGSMTALVSVLTHNCSRWTVSKDTKTLCNMYSASLLFLRVRRVYPLTVFCFISAAQTVVPKAPVQDTQKIMGKKMSSGKSLLNILWHISNNPTISWSCGLNCSQLVLVLVNLLQFLLKLFDLDGLLIHRGQTYNPPPPPPPEGTIWESEKIT